MILTQILQPTCIKVPLQSTDKESAINELVDLLDSNGLLKDKEDVIEQLMIREQQRSTGIGSGIGLPHCKSTAVEELVMAVGIVAEPIEFDSIDNKPVKILLLLVSPKDRTGPHIQALARISKMMLDGAFKSKLENADSPEQAYELISTRESQQ